MAQAMADLQMGHGEYLVHRTRGWGHREHMLDSLRTGSPTDCRPKPRLGQGLPAPSQLGFPGLRHTLSVVAKIIYTQGRMGACERASKLSCNPCNMSLARLLPA
jgi:hypothetical protein